MELTAGVLTLAVVAALASGVLQAVTIDVPGSAREELRERAQAVGQGATAVTGLLLVTAVVLAGLPAVIDGRRSARAAWTMATVAVLGVVVALVAVFVGAAEATAPRLFVSPRLAYRAGSLGFRGIAALLGATATWLAIGTRGPS